MRKNRLLWLAFVLLFVLDASSQTKKPSVEVFGGELDERASTRVLYESGKAIGELVIDFGRPVWKKEYDDPAIFDKMTRGKVWRLGKDFWTTLDTNLPLRITEKRVSIGYYYLGLYRSEDGDTWSLTFFDPVKIRSSKLDAFEIRKAPVEFKVPLKLQQSETLVDKLTLLLSYEKERMTNLTLTIAWGKLQLTAPIEVELTP
jgi:hypothetical protein